MFSHHTKIAAISGVLFFAMSIAALVLFVREVEKRKDALRVQITEQAETEFHKSSLASLKKALDDTREERAFILSRILKETDVITLLTLIEGVGQEQGVIVTTNALTVQPINEVFETLVVNVSIEGKHDAVLHAVSIFENLPYQSRVGSVLFEKTNTERGSSWKASCDIRVTKFKKV